VSQASQLLTGDYIALAVLAGWLASFLCSNLLICCWVFWWSSKCRCLPTHCALAWITWPTMASSLSGPAFSKQLHFQSKSFDFFGPTVVLDIFTKKNHFCAQEWFLHKRDVDLHSLGAFWFSELSLRVQCESKKSPPPRFFSDVFSKTVGNF